MSTADVLAVLAKLESAVSRIEKAVKAPPRTGYRPREVAEMTGIGYDAVLSLIHSGELPSVQVGRLHVVPAEAVPVLMSRVGEVIELDSRGAA